MLTTYRGNLLANIPRSLPDEFFDSILKRNGVEIERIVSTGQVTPPDEWYDQDWDEWVLLVQGEAKLLIQSDDQPIHLKTGDYVLIPAHCLHRVEWTHPFMETVWLAVHWR